MGNSSEGREQIGKEEIVNRRRSRRRPREIGQSDEKDNGESNKQHHLIVFVTVDGVQSKTTASPRRRCCY